MKLTTKILKHFNNIFSIKYINIIIINIKFSCCLLISVVHLDPEVVLVVERLQQRDDISAGPTAHSANLGQP